MDDADLLNLDQFIKVFRSELDISDSVDIKPDTSLIIDLEFDSLQMALAIEFLHLLVDRDVGSRTSDTLDALKTLRSAHTFYLTQSNMPAAEASADQSEVISLQNSVARLRPATAQDYPALYEIAVSNEIAWRWRYAGALPSYEEFLRTFSTGVMAQLVVSRVEDPRAIGQVVLYNPSLQNRTAYLAAVMSAEYVGSGIGGEAVVLFLRHAFNTWDLIKIYLDIPEFNAEQIVSGLNREFTLEGRLLGHVYFGGRRWDQLIYAIYRETFVARWVNPRDHSSVPLANSDPKLTLATDSTPDPDLG